MCEETMKLSRFVVPLIAAGTIFTAGCAHQTYYAPPPPPPPAYSVPPLIAQAQRDGFRAGRDDGARDAYIHFGYHPRRDRKYHDCPGYNPALGPFGPYRDAFRNAYLRGYYKGFYNQP